MIGTGWWSTYTHIPALLAHPDWSERAPFRGYLVVSQSGRISAIGAGDAPKIDAPVFDATGKIVMPGGIDPHVHLKWYTPHPDGRSLKVCDGVLRTSIASGMLMPKAARHR